MHLPSDISTETIFISSLAYLAFFVQGCYGLHLEAVLVPQYKFRGQNATLLCRYDLTDGEELFSLKWYKEDTEFYRFTPENHNKRYHNTDQYWITQQRRRNQPRGGQVQTWRVPGIKIDGDSSSPNGDSVVLKRVTFKSTGIYRCEVTTRIGPKGRIQMKESFQKMIVVELPDSMPIISGGDPLKNYKAGDILNLTCTSKPSNPAAKLEWTLNGKPVESHGPQQHIDAGKGLVSTKTDLYMRLNDGHFQDGRAIKVKCKGTIAAEFWRRDADVNIYNGNSEDNSFVKVLGVHEANWPGGACSLESLGLMKLVFLVMIIPLNAH